MDAAFLYLENSGVTMQVQAIMLLDPSTVPGGYSFEKVKAHLAERLPLLPEFRQRLALVPFDLHPPVRFHAPAFHPAAPAVSTAPTSTSTTTCAISPCPSPAPSSS